MPKPAVTEKQPRKKKVHVPPPDADSSALSPAIPRSFVFRRGQVAPSVIELIADLRLLMQPNSALKLQERKSNTMKDFLSVGPQLGISHFLCFTQREMGLNLRLIRIPHGPTLTFRIVSFSTQRDIVNMQKNPHSPASEYHHPPLVVLNNFSSSSLSSVSQIPSSTSSTSQHLPLLAAVLQNMFPPLHLPTLILSHCRRVVFFHFDPITQLIDMRHYLIHARPTGLTKPIQKIIHGKLIDLGQLDDISEYLDSNKTTSLLSSDSEADIEESAKVTLSDRYVGRGNRRSHRSAIKLQELGPRITMSLLKIEEEFCSGRVLYHHYLTKSAAEEQEMKRKKEQQKKEREERRKQQERNIQKNQQEGEQGNIEDDDDDDDRDRKTSSINNNVDDYDEDADWYEREVGEKPNPLLFGQRNSHNQTRITNNKRSHPDTEIDAAIDKEDTTMDAGRDEKKKRRRVGGRRVGAGPRKPWIRGRGGGMNRRGRGRGGGVGR